MESPSLEVLRKDWTWHSVPWSGLQGDVLRLNSVISEVFFSFIDPVILGFFF